MRVFIYWFKNWRFILFLNLRFICIGFLSILFIDILLNWRTFLLLLLKHNIFQDEFILFFKMLFSFHILKIINKTIVVFNLLWILNWFLLLSNFLHPINIKHRGKSFHILRSMLFIHWKLTELIINFVWLLYHAARSHALLVSHLVLLAICNAFGNLI